MDFQQRVLAQALDERSPLLERLKFLAIFEVIRENAHKLYPGMQLSGATLFRLTRDAEVDVEDEELTVREAVELQVCQRRLEPAVRLEFARGADPELRTALMQPSGCETSAWPGSSAPMRPTRRCSRQTGLPRSRRHWARTKP
jgi:polyphosphate kinase